MDLKLLSCRISALSVFRGILDKKEMRAFLDFLKADDICQKLSCYGEFINSLGIHDGSFSAFLEKAVCEDENIYIKAVAKNKEVSASIKANAEKELELFSYLTSLTCAELFEGTSYSGYIPEFENKKVDFSAVYTERLNHIERYGYGIFATAGMFRVENGEIVAVEAADDITTDIFIGYEKERQQVMDNTEALTLGKSAQNVLLCGDAGTGKSSTVKAVANAYFDKGVRLIELRKDQLFSLSHVMGRIADNPLKFIIFIDDLSFNKNDDCFSMLKAALEGSASAKASNAVIYATSNRRHIVKERFSERGHEDDVHHSDTVQELLSLSDRFGLVVYFSKPNKKLYLDIVHELAKRDNLDMDEKELEIKAEAFALAKGSRSPRAAQQFIKLLYKEK
ncbi:MAG: ATP-binding protein [Clostridia bacterium]|nr:ATP-binding protein [Clostridia bacterium]